MHFENFTNSFAFVLHSPSTKSQVVLWSPAPTKEVGEPRALIDRERPLQQACAAIYTASNDSKRWRQKARMLACHFGTHSSLEGKEGRGGGGEVGKALSLTYVGRPQTACLLPVHCALAHTTQRANLGEGYSCIHKTYTWAKPAQVSRSGYVLWLFCITHQTTNHHHPRGTN